MAHIDGIELRKATEADAGEIPTLQRENVAFYERHGYRRVPGDDGLVHVAKPRASGRPAST